MVDKDKRGENLDKQNEHPLGEPHEDFFPPENLSSKPDRSRVNDTQEMPTLGAQHLMEHGEELPAAPAHSPEAHFFDMPEFHENEDLGKPLSTRQEKIVESAVGKYSPDVVRKDVEQKVNVAMKKTIDDAAPKKLAEKLSQTEPHIYGSQNPKSGAAESNLAATDARSVLEAKANGKHKKKTEAGEFESFVDDIHEHVQKEDQQDVEQVIVEAEKKLDEVFDDRDGNNNLPPKRA